MPMNMGDPSTRKALNDIYRQRLHSWKNFALLAVAKLRSFRLQTLLLGVLGVSMLALMTKV